MRDAGGSETEVTPEMITAGVIAFDLFFESYGCYGAMAEIYKAITNTRSSAAVTAD